VAAGAPTMNQLDQSDLVERALTSLSPEKLGTLCFQMTEIASPTGEERQLAEFLAERLRTAGLQVRISVVGDEGASLIAVLRGSADGPRVWLYAPPRHSIFGSSG
jgi:hypothetical protein